MNGKGKGKEKGKENRGKSVSVHFFRPCCSRGKNGVSSFLGGQKVKMN